MKLQKILSKESVSNAIRSLGKLRIRVNHGTILTFSALILILFVAFTIRMLPLRWEIETGTLHLSEFDPHYQYSLTKYMVENGLISPYWPELWVNYQHWHPEGLNMGTSLWSLPMTAAFFYTIITALGINIDLMSFCAIVPAVMGTLAVLVLYFLGKDIGGKTVGMFASLFLALSPAFIQRTALGFFDTEVVGVFALLLCSLLFLRAIEEERSMNSTMGYSLGAAGALAYFVTGWGAAYYLIGLMVLFVFALVLLKRYTRRILLAYSLTFGLGLLIAINNPRISLGYLTGFVVLPVAGVFILLCAYEIVRNLTSVRTKISFSAIFLIILVGGFISFWHLGYIEDIAGKFWSVANPFLRGANPLVESVAEHRISAWGSIYYDLGIGIFFFLIGLFFVLRKRDNKNLFLLLFGLTTLYFAASMVRLLILLAPAFGIIAAIGIAGILKPFYTLMKEPPRIATKKLSLEHVGKEFSGTAVFLIFLVLMTNFAFSPQTGGLPRVYRQAYTPMTITAGSLPIAPAEPVREWLDMLVYLNRMQNSSVVVCSWWDYGYWLSIMGNVTSLADNATINSTQIENIGFIFMANETRALEMLKTYDANYILVFTTVYYDGKWLDGAGGDNGKWTWMAKISGKAQQRFIEDGWIDETSSWTDETKFGNFTDKWVWNDFGKDSTIYKLMSYAKSRWVSTWLGAQDPDYVGTPIYFKEAYFAGLALNPNDSGKYGGIIPLVCLYEIDWAKYYDRQQG